MIYVLWHHEFAEGKIYSDKIFAAFTRDISDPLSRTSGIPVTFRSIGKTSEYDAPKSIDFDASYRNAVVLLVDDQMVISQTWQHYISKIDAFASKSKGQTRIFPVAINHNSFNFSVAATNYIRLFEVQAGSIPQAIKPDYQAPTETEHTARFELPKQDNIPSSGLQHKIKLPGGAEVSISVNINIHSGTQPPAEVIGLEMEKDETEIDLDHLERKVEFLLGKLTHEFTRLLYDRVPEAEAEEMQRAAPVRVFISHAKADGTEIAEMIRDHIHADTSLKSFFDANDIAAGHQFSSELHSAISESALICIQTDMYATREWCLWEVITAKRLDRPVAVLNAVSQNEPRSFPYLGNVPTMRWDKESMDIKRQIQQVIAMILFEVLSSKYHRLFEEELIRMHGLPEGTTAIGHPPELFTVLKLRDLASQGKHDENNRLLVLYPDPPLGDEESRLLEDLAPHLRFITPTQVPTMFAQSS